MIWPVGETPWTRRLARSVSGRGRRPARFIFVGTLGGDRQEDVDLVMRQDEARHVRFGIAHAKYSMEADIGAARRFGSAVEARAEFLKSVSGVGALIEESLIIYSGGGMSPSSLRAGTRRVAALYDTMHTNRVKRLAAAGFGIDQADHMSRLHTPNFM
jgi:hypothetical protein